MIEVVGSTVLVIADYSRLVHSARKGQTTVNRLDLHKRLAQDICFPVFVHIEVRFDYASVYDRLDFSVIAVPTSKR